MRGVGSFMNWHRVPEFETVSSTADDNPFAGTRVQPTGKVSVKLPVDDWLCRKMSSLNLTIKEGYPTRNTDNTGLLRDQFIKTPRPSRWYGMHPEKDSESSTVRTWSPDPAKLNHSFSRVARRNLPSAPPSRAFSQDLRRWERAAREQTIMCNQAAGLSRCLTRVQDSMNSQLKTLRMDSKGKSSEKMKQAVGELEYLTTFNRSVSQAMARTMQDLSEAVFINMANFTLARRDSYLDYLHAGVKQDTLHALRTSPVHLNALFPDQLIAKAEEEKSEERRSSDTSHRQQGRFYPYAASDKATSHHTDKKNVPAWKQSKTSSKLGKVVVRPQHSPRSLPRGSSLINDNHCVIPVTGQKNSVLVTGQGDLNPAPVVSENSKVTLNFNVDSHVANAHFVTGLQQRKGVNPNACQLYTKIKYVKDVFLCRSLAFCKSCHQCPTCCFRSSCRGEVKPVLGEMGNPGFKSKSGKHSEGGLHTPLPVQTPLDKVTDCNKQLPQSNQTVLPFRGTVSADKQKCSRTGGKSKLTGVLQPAIFGTQTQQPVETDPRPEHLEHLFKHRVVQDGDPRDNKNLPTDRGVGHIHRFQRRILPHTNSQSVQEVHAFSPPGSVLPVQSPSLWPVHSSHGVHSGGQRGQTHGTSKGYKDPPVSRRLAGESLYPRHLSPAYSNPSHTVPGTRVAGEQGKVGTGPTAGHQLRRLPVRPEGGQGQTNRGTLADLDRQDQINTVGSGMPGPNIHVPHRATHSNRITSPLRATTRDPYSGT